MNAFLNGLLASFFVLICVATGLAQPENTAQKLMDQAYREQDLRKAIGLYSDVIQIKPNADIAYFGRAMVRSQPTIEEFSEALSDIIRAIQLNNSVAKYFAQRAYIYVQLSDYEQAIQDYQQAIRLAPSKADYYSGLSYCQTKLGRFAEGEKTAQQCIDLDPASPYGYRNRGRARLRKNQTDLAIADFQASLQRKHGQPYRVYSDLGEAYEQKQQPQQALAYYRQSLGLKADYSEALVGRYRLEQKQQPAPAPALTTAPTFTGHRVALVIGNSNYRYVSSLGGQPVNDARDMQKRLQEIGFEAWLATDADYDSTYRALQFFYGKAKGADVALIFYAGHGMQHYGENYLLPVNIQFDTTRLLTKQSVSVTSMIDGLQTRQPRYCIIILDACRDDPAGQQQAFRKPAPKDTTRSLATTLRPLPTNDIRGFRPIYVENKIKNCYIALATAPGATARNGPQQHGFYTAALLNHLKRGRRLDDVFRDVRNDVIIQTQKSGALQQPEYIDRTIDLLVL
ncbi:caspase family protein [Spirosoma linguale]|uniref:Peptidase C14 caspase catalytic subunit p20 n=1 Tax=Spirosoma linguale (strain ATCC 33905 / DSM 74 / LMG 10896 / Claus 1) TaxID=504472 RepID=D2QUE2_SPILD|nr:peptidase C14 caspase catalytic subunit p20 [Spirosoma linguale DSM 74]